MIINSLFLPRNTDRHHRTMKAPARMDNPTGRPRRPTPTGSWPYTLKACVGLCVCWSACFLGMSGRTRRWRILKLSKFCHEQGINKIYIPKHDDTEEIRARDKCDHERQTEDPGCLLQASREHGVFSSIDFPEAEADEHNCTNNQRSEDVC